MVRTFVLSVIAVSATTTACRYHGRDLTGDGGGDDVDGRIDAGVFADSAFDAIPGDAPDACEAWTPHNFDPCMIPAPGPTDWTIDAGTHVYDTDADTLDGAPITDTIGAGTSITFDQGTNQPVRLLSVPKFSLNGGATVLAVTGSLPLIIASWTDITIGGTLDAGSHLGALVGAGADSSACSANPPGLGGDADSGGGSGGGGGGGFQGTGGDGGPGDNPSPAAGGPGAVTVGVPAVVRGGCAGANSGTAGSGAQPPANSGTRSSGGAGGGAIQLSAVTKVKITAGGHLLAGGSGGGGSPTGSGDGGGGGGSGGFIALDSVAVDVDGRAIANGGGGGSSQVFGAAGNPGEDGGNDDVAANGGIGVAGCATDGGDGSAAAVLDGGDVTGTVTCGGGGGGGGAGYIIVWSPAYTPAGGAKLSPPVTLNP